MNGQAAPANWESIKNGIFAGESGGDYNALFGFSNRAGGRWSNVKLTGMTVDQAIAFSDPSGEYGQWTKEELRRIGQKPRVATPMGAYQIVGTTLRMAKADLGLTGGEMMDEAMQDRLGLYIYNKQGTGAWEGYKGPKSEAVRYFDDGGDGPAWDDTTYVGVDGATRPDIYQQQEADENGPQAYGSWWEELEESMASSSWTAQGLRWMTEGVADPFYTPSQMFDVDGLEQYPENYHDFLLSATSADNAKSRIQWVEEDMVRRERLGAGGGSAIAAEIVGGILDPVPLVAGVLTGGVGMVARGGMAAKVAAGAASGAAFNIGEELVAQEVFDSPYADPVMAGIVGGALGALGGALSRGASTAGEAEMIHVMANRTARGVLRSSTAKEAINEGVTDTLRSVGAAQNPHVIDPLMQKEASYLTEMQDESVPYGFGGKADLSVTGQMTSASSPLVRLTGMHLHEPAAGLKGNAVTPDSVDTVHMALRRQFMGNFMTEFHPARLAYLKDAGIMRLNFIQRSKAEADFSAQVARYVEDPNPSPDTSPHVVRAATAFRNGMAQWNRELREAGLAELPDNKFYVPKVANHETIAAVDMNYSAQNIHRWIGEAILRHTPDLDAKIVERMAKGYWRVLRRAAYGMGDEIDRAITSNDFDGFKRAMMENLEETEALNEAEMKAAFDAATGALDSTKRGKGKGSKGVGYLKKRTLLDYTAEFNITDAKGVTRKMAVRDLFENDAEALFTRYTRSMAGRVAFARMKVVNPDKMETLIDGIRSESDLQKVADMFLESYRQTGRPIGEWKAEADNAIQNLHFSWKKINGIPVWDNNTSYARWARRIKSMQFSRLMSNMGLNQVQEAWKITSLLGVKATLTQLPSIRAMVRAVNTGELTGDQLLDELSAMTGIGLDGLHARLDLRINDDRIGDSGGGSFGRGLDRVLDTASHVTSSVSLMRAIHDFQQRWALKAITQRMTDMARTARQGDGSFDMGKIGRGEWERLASMGLSKEDAEMLFRNLLDHSEFDGKRIVGVNVPKWDPEAVSKYRHFLGRYTDRLVQRNDYGGLAKWMSHPVASMFTQFRSFVFGAWAKSTLWALNHRGLTDPRMLTLLLGEMAAGVATYAVRQSHLLATDEGREKFREEMTDPAKLLTSGWARTATASVLPMVLDTALHTAEKMDVGPGPLFGQARSSGSATSAFLGSPVFDQGAALRTAGRGAIQWARDGEGMSQSEVKSAVRALPLPLNFVPFSAALGALIKDLPEK